MKSGVKTSEFWVGLGGAIVVTILTYTDIMDEATATKIVGIIMTYVGGRSLAKIAPGK